MVGMLFDDEGPFARPASLLGDAAVAVLEPFEAVRDEVVGRRLDVGHRQELEVQVVAGRLAAPSLASPTPKRTGPPIIETPSAVQAIRRTSSGSAGVPPTYLPGTVIPPT